MYMYFRKVLPIPFSWFLHPLLLCNEEWEGEKDDNWRVPFQWSLKTELINHIKFINHLKRLVWVWLLSVCSVDNQAWDFSADPRILKFPGGGGGGGGNSCFLYQISQKSLPWEGGQPPSHTHPPLSRYAPLMLGQFAPLLKLSSSFFQIFPVDLIPDNLYGTILKLSITIFLF